MPNDRTYAAFTESEHADLVGLLVADIQKRRRNIRLFTPAPGQSDERAAAALALIRDRARRLENILEKIDPRALANIGGRVASEAEPLGR